MALSQIIDKPDSNVRDWSNLTVKSLKVNGVTIDTNGGGGGGGVPLRNAGSKDFYIDVAVGNDANDGETSGTPVKTWDRLMLAMSEFNYDEMVINLTEGQVISTFTQLAETPYETIDNADNVEEIEYIWDFTPLTNCCSKVRVVGNSLGNQTLTPTAQGTHDYMTATAGNNQWTTLDFSGLTVSNNRFVYDTVKQRYYYADALLNNATTTYLYRNDNGSIVSNPMLLYSEGNMTTITFNNESAIVSNVPVVFERLEFRRDLRRCVGSSFTFKGCNFSFTYSIVSDTPVYLVGCRVGLDSVGNMNCIIMNSEIFDVAYNSRFECSESKINHPELYDNCTMICNKCVVPRIEMYNRSKFISTGSNDYPNSNIYPEGNCEVHMSSTDKMEIDSTLEIYYNSIVYLDGEIYDTGTSGRMINCTDNSELYVQPNCILITTTTRTGDWIRINNGSKMTNLGTIVQSALASTFSFLLIKGGSVVYNQSTMEANCTGTGVFIESGSRLYSSGTINNVGTGQDLLRGSGVAGAFVFDTTFSTTATDQMTQVISI